MYFVKSEYKYDTFSSKYLYKIFLIGSENFFFKCWSLVSNFDSQRKTFFQFHCHFVVVFQQFLSPLPALVTPEHQNYELKFLGTGTTSHDVFFNKCTCRMYNISLQIQSNLVPKTS